MVRTEALINQRKVIPFDGRNEGRLVSNPPDVPSVVREEFKFPYQEKPSSRFLWDPDYEDNGYGSERAIQVTVPLTPFFRIAIGGGRTGGGGTSREALRRAKRKMKVRPTKDPL